MERPKSFGGSQIVKGNSKTQPISRRYVALPIPYAATIKRERICRQLSLLNCAQKI